MPHPAPIRDDSIRAGLGRWFVGLVAAGAVVVLLFTLLAFGARWSWRLELLCHFRVQYFWLLAVAAILLLFARRWKWAAVAASGAALNLALIAPIYWPPGKPPANGTLLRIVSFNVLSHNDRYADVLAYLRQEGADIVLLMEVSPQWAEQLATLRGLYPHQHLVPRTDNFGIALLSKQLWREAQTVELGSAGVPSVVARFDRSGTPLTFIGTHPLPPGSAHRTAQRNEQLATVASLARLQTGSVIVAGDLNTSEHSPCFADLLRQSGLRNSRQGFGVQASWSPRMPPLSIPIDHCLVSPDLAVRQRTIGPDLGSDHRPVSALVQ